MRHRKKLVIVVLVAIIVGAALVFWPRDHPQARQAFAAVRGMVEVQPEQALPAIPEVADKTAQVELHFVIAKLNLTDARTQLFAETVPSEKMVAGRVKSARSVLDILQPLDVTAIVSEPRMVPISGQPAQIAMGGEVVTVHATAGGPVTNRQRYGVFVGVQADVTGSGAVKLQIDCELSHLAGTRTVATPQGPVKLPDVKAIRSSAREELKVGEALLIGGLTQKATGRVTFKTPYLCDLPGIGSWFCFTRQREFEEELVVLITPRIIRPEGKASVLTNPPPTAIPRSPVRGLSSSLKLKS